MKSLRNSILVLLLSLGTAACGQSVTGPDAFDDGYLPDPGSYAPDAADGDDEFYLPDPGS